MKKAMLVSTLLGCVVLSIQLNAKIIEFDSEYTKDYSDVTAETIAGSKDSGESKDYGKDGDSTTSNSNNQKPADVKNDAGDVIRKPNQGKNDAGNNNRKPGSHNRDAGGKVSEPGKDRQNGAGKDPKPGRKVLIGGKNGIKPGEDRTLLQGGGVAGIVTNRPANDGKNNFGRRGDNGSAESISKPPKESQKPNSNNDGINSINQRSGDSAKQEGGKAQNSGDGEEHIGGRNSHEGGDGKYDGAKYENEGGKSQYEKGDKDRSRDRNGYAAGDIDKSGGKSNDNGSSDDKSGGKGVTHRSGNSITIYLTKRVNFNEGDAKDRKMKFFISFSKKLREDLHLKYWMTTLNKGEKGRVTVDKDFVYPSGELTIKKGKSYGKVEIEVIDDIIPEEDEYFSLVFKKPEDSKYSFYDNRATGVIEDDDVRLRSIDTKGNYLIGDHNSTNGKIITKIVNEPFKIDINTSKDFMVFVGIDRDKDIDCNEELKYKVEDGVTKSYYDCNKTIKITEKYDDEMDIDQVLLHTYDSYDKLYKSCSGERNVTILANENNITSGELLTLDILATRATPCAYIEVKGHSAVELNTTNEEESKSKELIGKSDYFAIRPEKFIITGSSISKAGSPTSLQITALKHDYLLDINHSNSLGYNEANGTSFQITASQVNPSCTDGSIGKSGIGSFYDGNLNANISYDNVGEINVTVKEVRGSEFAIIDVNDGNITLSQLQIEPASTMIKYVPDHFDLDPSFVNTHTTHGYAFYSNSLSSSPYWTYTIEAHTLHHDVATNYHEDCVGSYVTAGVDLDATLNVTSRGDSQILNSSEKDVAINSINQDILIDANVPISEFSQGSSTKKINVNFGRNNNIPKQPLNIKEVSASVADEYGASDSNSDPIPATGVVYQYMRTYVDSPIIVVGKKELNTAIHYEAYRGTKGTVSRSVSGDSDWDKVIYEPSSGRMAIGTTPTVKYVDPKRSQPSNVGNTTLKVTTIDIPEKNMITIMTKPDFVYGNSKIDVDISFVPDSATWTGKGDIGKTVDTDISKQNLIRKMNW